MILSIMCGNSREECEWIISHHASLCCSWAYLWCARFRALKHPRTAKARQEEDFRKIRWLIHSMMIDWLIHSFIFLKRYPTYYGSTDGKYSHRICALHRVEICHFWKTRHFYAFGRSLTTYRITFSSKRVLRTGRYRLILLNVRRKWVCSA